MRLFIVSFCLGINWDASWNPLLHWARTTKRHTNTVRTLMFAIKIARQRGLGTGDRFQGTRRQRDCAPAIAPSFSGRSRQHRSSTPADPRGVAGSDFPSPALSAHAVLQTRLSSDVHVMMSSYYTMRHT